MDQPANNVKLVEILEKTSTTVTLREDGSLFVDHYDFSPTANEHFGNDVAFMLIIPQTSVNKLHELLKSEQGLMDRLFNNDPILLRIQKRFKGYHEFQTYLNNSQIPFEKKFDSWA